ncbi:MAG: DUF805 domain-containing protein [Hyphomicrobiaceae bacterium]
MSGFFQSVPLVLDPRGRCNRKGLLMIMLITLGLQIGLGGLVAFVGFDFTGPLATAIKLAFVWVAISASIQRLHDVGLSGWWLLWGLIGLMIWSSCVSIAGLFLLGPEVLLPFSAHFIGLFIVIYIPLLSATLWMHFAKGEPKANRFGPVPDGSGFSSPVAAAEDISGPVPA